LIDDLIMNDTSAPKKSPNLLIRHIALPQDHGSWVFLLSPLFIGLFAANEWSFTTILLILAALSAFLIRQPVTIAVKAYSGRRAQAELKAAWFWMMVYGLLGLIALLGLIWQGFGYLLYLAIPGIPVFAWHLYLVSKRLERRQAGVELVGSGVLALAAPAAYWTGLGYPDPTGWLLFGLVWLQSAASIIYAYLRLEQRGLVEKPEPAQLLRMGRRALLYTSFNLALVMILSATKITPFWLFLPYLLQWLETLRGVLQPAIKVKPTAIGIRQLIVSTIFTILFILTWSYR